MTTEFSFNRPGGNITGLDSPLLERLRGTGTGGIVPPGWAVGGGPSARTTMGMGSGPQPTPGRLPNPRIAAARDQYQQPGFSDRRPAPTLPGAPSRPSLAGQQYQQPGLGRPDPGLIPTAGPVAPSRPDIAGQEYQQPGYGKKVPVGLDGGTPSSGRPGLAGQEYQQPGYGDKPVPPDISNYNGSTTPGTVGPTSAAGGTPPAGWTPSNWDAGRLVTPDELVSNQLNNLLKSNSAYMQNADRRGREFAAQRGNLNSSIAAGAARRAAIEAGMPIAESDAAAYRSANDQTYKDYSTLRQMKAAGDIENWLSSETFNREYNGQLAMMPIQSAFDMLAYVTQRGLEDPAVYTPDVLSGFNNFFNQNMFDIIGRYFGRSTPGGG